MISTEILRRYPFFSGLNDSQLKHVAMLSQEVDFENGSTIFEECDPANRFFVLMDGSVDLYYRSQEEFHPTIVKEFFVGEINPGEAFGTSSMIEPYLLNATARTSGKARVIEIDALGLRLLMDQDRELGWILTHQVIKILVERVMALRVQLAAEKS